MKFILMLILSLSFESVNAQNNSELIGTWKLVSFWDNEVYFNVETDSSYLTHEMLVTYPDTTDQKKYITQAKTIYGAFNFRFENDSILLVFMDTVFMLKAHYKIDKVNGVFEMTTPNSLGQDITDKFEYTFTENLLILSMKLEDKICKFGLRKN